MGDFLLYYKRPDPTTWVYLSSFLTIGLFFVFHRVWSVRNLDLVLLILFAPGLLLVHEGYRREIAASVRPVTRTLVGTSAGNDVNSTNPNVATNLANRQNLGTENDQSPPRSQAGSDAEEDLDSNEAASTELAPSNPSNTADSDSSRGLETDPKNEPPNTNGSLNTNESLNASGPLNDPANASADPNPEINSADDVRRRGFFYLFVIEFLIVIRMMFDLVMVRRPKLDPNLTSGGLTFIGISLFIFMMANVVNSNAMTQRVQGPELGPGYPFINMLPAIPTRPGRDVIGSKSIFVSIDSANGINESLRDRDTESEASATTNLAIEGDLSERTVDNSETGDSMASPPLSTESGKATLSTSRQQRLAVLAKILAIVAHGAIVLGMVLIGQRHFGDVRCGMGCACLYLMLPYTAQMTGRVDHALPAAALLWAVFWYRKPFLSGLCFGLAAGLVYYPLFLIPLWISFYWSRGARRFSTGVAASLALLMLLLALDSSRTLVEHLQQMFGILNPIKPEGELFGFWAVGWSPYWRLPVIVAFVILSLVFISWPAQKHLGTLIAGTAAIMAAAQFWHGYGGGMYIAWFLPLLLLAIFRPNLQDRVATKVVSMVSGAAP